MYLYPAVYKLFINMERSIDECWEVGKGGGYNYIDSAIITDQSFLSA